MSGRFTYPVDLSTDEDGWLLSTFPDFPEAGTDGTDRAEALEEAADCVAEAIAGRIVNREDIPAPSPARRRPTVSPDAVIAAKAALYLALREAGMSKTALARRLGCGETEVRRMLDPAHVSKIGRLEEALATFGKRLVVDVRAA